MLLWIVRHLLHAERRRLERATSGPYDAARSRRLDRVLVALEALE
jgi:hypothetical protein